SCRVPSAPPTLPDRRRLPLPWSRTCGAGRINVMARNLDPQASGCVCRLPSFRASLPRFPLLPRRLALYLYQKIARLALQRRADFIEQFKRNALGFSLFEPPERGVFHVGAFRAG